MRGGFFWYNPPMRLAVLSDIHGNLPALQAVLDDLQGQSIDGYILAGDYYAGPHGPQTRQRLQDLPGWRIQGNGEVNLLRYAAGELPPAWYTHQQFAVHRWANDQLTPEDWDFIHTLPEQQVIQIPGTAPIRLTHGWHCGPYEGIFPHPEQVRPAADPRCAYPRPEWRGFRPANGRLERVFAETSEAVFVCGHTHMPWIVEWGGRLALNPGAVCGPLNGCVGAQYALLAWEDGRWQAALRVAAYDVAAERRAFINSGLYETGGALARAFLSSIETGYDLSRDFLALANQMAGEADGGRERAYQRGDILSDEAWLAAARAFPWPDGGFGV